MSPKKFLVTEDNHVGNMKAGTIVYACHMPTYGLVSDDERHTGIEHTAITLDPRGGYPFFTIPKYKLEEITNDA